MGVPLAIILGSVIIAAAILFTFRWEDAGVRSADGNPAALRLDHWTGKVAICDLDVQRSLIAKAAYLRCRAP
jgi:hypothetical protein